MKCTFSYARLPFFKKNVFDALMMVSELGRNMYFIVIGSRRQMPPDALQQKAYCTNPGL